MYDINIFKFVIVALVVLPQSNYKCESVMRNQEEKDDTPPNELSYTDEVGHCLRDGGGVSSCLAAGAFVLLESASQKRSFSITDGLDLYENEVNGKETRTNFPIEVDGEATDFNTLFDASSKFLQRRNLRWSLDSLYPGLELCVGSPNAGTPILQFLLDPRHGLDERRLSTSRLLIKRAVLPYILGLKLNLVTIMPLVFAALIFLTKKAFLLSKFAFLFMAMTGYSTMSHLTHHHITTPTSGYGFNHANHDNYYYKDFREGQSLYSRSEAAGKKVVWEEREKKTV